MKRYLVESAAIRQNLETLKKRAGKARLFAVVKGNGYGLGLVPLAAICRDAGVDTFCVTEVSDAKLFAGTVSGSVAVTADAFNNLSDAGSSVVTLLGSGVSEAGGELAGRLLGSLGVARRVEESQLDAVTALSGSGLTTILTVSVLPESRRTSRGKE